MLTKESAQALIIAHLMKGNFIDYAAICTKLVADDPVRFAELAGLTAVSGWVAEARDMVKTSNAIGAIKAVRSGTGVGLWEAKQIVDAYRYDNIPDATRWTDDMYEMLRQVRGY